jgi:hypothetical protein
MSNTFSTVVGRSRARHDHRRTRRASHSPCSPISLHAVTIADRPDLRASVAAADAAVFPRFLLHSEFRPLWDDVYATFPEHQLVLCDSRSGAVVAHVNSVPFHWNGDVGDLPGDACALVRRALADRRVGVRPTALGALQAVVHPAQQGRGLARRPLERSPSTPPDSTWRTSSHRSGRPRNSAIRWRRWRTTRAGCGPMASRRTRGYVSMSVWGQPGPA